MNAIKGIYQKGQIVFDAPADWPEGTEVMIQPLPHAETLGIREEDWSESPEAIAEWLKWYDSLEPLEFTPQEQAEIAAWRQKIKEYTIANMHRGVERLFP